MFVKAAALRAAIVIGTVYAESAAAGATETAFVWVAAAERSVIVIVLASGTADTGATKACCILKTCTVP